MALYSLRSFFTNPVKTCTSSSYKALPELEEEDRTVDFEMISVHREEVVGANFVFEPEKVEDCAGKYDPDCVASDNNLVGDFI